MRNIKNWQTFNELNKSTYLSAAKRIEEYQPHTAEELRTHALNQESRKPKIVDKFDVQIDKQNFLAKIIHIDWKEAYNYWLETKNIKIDCIFKLYSRDINLSDKEFKVSIGNSGHGFRDYKNLNAEFTGRGGFLNTNSPKHKLDFSFRNRLEANKFKKYINHTIEGQHEEDPNFKHFVKVVINNYPIRQLYRTQN